MKQFLREWMRRLLTPRPRTTVTAGELKRFGIEERDEVDPFNPFPEPVALEIRDVLDLHTFAPRDVPRVVEEYLIEARRSGFRQVRLIHGKGKGVQRELIRRILARTFFVASFTDAPPEAGGWGATIVRLVLKDDSRESES